MGWNDPVAAVMMHASIGDILHVTIDGEFVKWNGRLTAQNYPRVRREFAKSADRLQRVLRDTPLPVLEGQVSPGVYYAVPTYADVQRGSGTGYGSQFWR